MTPLLASPMRTVDIVGLVAVMALALAALYWHDVVGDALARPVGRTGDSAADRGFRVVTRLAVVVLAGGGALLMALALLGVIVERPGPYPGGVATKVAAIAGLVALVLIVARRVVPSFSGRDAADRT